MNEYFQSREKIVDCFFDWGIHSMRLEAASKAKVAVNLRYIERTFRAGQGSETALSHSAGRQSVASCSCQNTLAGFFPALTCEKLEVKRESWCHLEGESRHLRGRLEKFLQQNSSFNSEEQAGW